MSFFRRAGGEGEDFCIEEERERIFVDFEEMRVIFVKESRISYRRLVFAFSQIFLSPLFLLSLSLSGV